MGQFWNFIQHKPQLIVVAIFVLISFISWVTRTIEAQRKRRQAVLDRERAELEGLRTGPPTAQRPAPAPPQRPAVPSAQASLEDIAARRRAAMEQLQRRAAGLPPAPSQPQASAARQEVARVLGQVLGVPGTSLPRPAPRPGQTRPIPPRPVQRPPTPAPTARPAPRPAPRPNAESDKAYAVNIPKASQRTSSPPPAAPRPQGTSARPGARADAAAAYALNIPQASQSTSSRAPSPLAPASQRAFAVSRGDLKRSILMREILAPPVSLRDAGADQVA